MKLKPCPFCGGEADVWGAVIDDEYYYEAYCTACDCMTPKFHTEKSAITFWNRRRPIDKIVEQLIANSGIVEDGDGHAGHVIFTEKAIEIVKGGKE